MDNIRALSSLGDTKELRKLIIENPDLPLVVFCGEDSWSGEYAHEQADVTRIRIGELTHYQGNWMEKEDFSRELAEILCNEKEHDDLSEKEFIEMADKKVREAEFIRAITIYVG